MKITINRLPALRTFDEWAEGLGLVMEVYQRSYKQSPTMWFAHFKDCHIMEKGCLVGAFGDGATPEEAIEDYKKRITGTRIAIGVDPQKRREIDVPTLWKEEKQ